LLPLELMGLSARMELFLSTMAAVKASL